MFTWWLGKTGVSSLIKSFGVHDSKESNTFVHSKQIQVREQMSQHFDICSRTCICFECTNVLLSFESCTPNDLINDDTPVLPSHHVNIQQNPFVN